jgi:hypothetical protein
MPYSYSPIARNFFRLRDILMETLELPRKSIRPKATFDDLVSPDQRARVWDHLMAEGFRAPALTLAPALRFWVLMAVLGLASIWAIVLGSWWGYVVGVVEMAIIASKFTKNWRTHLEPARMTLEEAAVAMTDYRACAAAGYRLSRREIAIKVKLLLWECSGVAPNEIRDDHRLFDLGVM